MIYIYDICEWILIPLPCVYCLNYVIVSFKMFPKITSERSATFPFARAGQRLKGRVALEPYRRGERG